MKLSSHLHLFLPLVILISWSATITSNFLASDRLAASDAPWPEPVIISSPGNPAVRPSVVADPSGRVHVVWAEKGDLNSACAYDSITYSFYSQGKWSTPLDVLIPPDESCLWQTAIAYNKLDGRLNVVWAGNDLFYSSAPAAQAGSAKSWRTPILIENNVQFPAVAVDARGIIHVAYSKGRPGKGLYYTQSTDNGFDWSEPQIIYNSEDLETGISNISFAIDNKDRVHMVWTDEFNDGSVSRGGFIYYTHSLDGGQTWEPNQIIDQKGPKYDSNYGPGEITITSFGDEGVFLVWAGPPSSQRWYQWSLDGGSTWNQPKPVASNEEDGAKLRNFSEGMGIAVDSLERVHLVTSGSQQFTYLVWQQDSLVQPGSHPAFRAVHTPYGGKPRK